MIYVKELLVMPASPPAIDHDKFNFLLLTLPKVECQITKGESRARILALTLLWTPRWPQACCHPSPGCSYCNQEGASLSALPVCPRADRDGWQHCRERAVRLGLSSQEKAVGLERAL